MSHSFPFVETMVHDVEQNMSTKKILIFVIIVILIAVMLPSHKLKITKVLDGSTIELSNGTKVKLIGITMTNEGKEYLNTFIGKPVDLMPDQSASFEQKKLRKGDVVYAYVRVNKGYLCLNSAMLKLRMADVLTGGYLNDSLSVYKDYARRDDKEENVTPTPTPIKPEPINYAEEGFNLPQYTPNPERRKDGWCFCDNDLNMLKDVCDYNLPYTRGFAAHLASGVPGEFSIGQVCEIFDYCYKKWRYVNDPRGQDFVTPASETICYGLVGDCDDFAVLMASCVLAVGGSATVVCGYKDEEGDESSGHAWAEVDMNDFNNKDPEYIFKYICNRFPSFKISQLHSRQDGNHQWLNLDWQAAYPGGPYYSNNGVFYSCVDGQWTIKNGYN